MPTHGCFADRSNAPSSSLPSSLALCAPGLLDACLLTTEDELMASRGTDVSDGWCCYRRSRTSSPFVVALMGALLRGIQV